MSFSNTALLNLAITADCIQPLVGLISQVNQEYLFWQLNLPITTRYVFVVEDDGV